jgi:hypothetical protein
VVLLLALAAAAPAPAYRVGISDQQPAVFTNPLFGPLDMRLARYVTPWDVMYRAAYRNQLTAWLTQAALARQHVLVAFESSHTRGRERKAPTSVQYTKAIKRFRKAFPEVNDIQPWNEANRCQSKRGSGGYVVGQPICKKPKMAALYYLAARRVFRGARITGLDVLDGKNVDGKRIEYALPYIRAFSRYAKPRPKYWGIHNYSDSNRFSTKRTRALLKATRSGAVWLTEAGGIVSLGKNFPYSPRRAAKALRCMFTLAKISKRITRVYVYQFHGIRKGRAFDAGLINPDNTVRPGYDVVKHRKAGRCHR